MEYRLDETDRQLLRLLQTNARASTAHLARQMNLARTTVVARIARLEQEGVIAGYGVRLGARVEQSAVRAYCGIRVQPKTATSVMQALNRFTEVEEVSAVSGQYDYMVFVRCESNEKLERAAGPHRPDRRHTADLYLGGAQPQDRPAHDGGAEPAG